MQKSLDFGTESQNHEINIWDGVDGTSGAAEDAGGYAAAVAATGDCW